MTATTAHNVAITISTISTGGSIGRSVLPVVELYHCNNTVDCISVNVNVNVTYFYLRAISLFKRVTTP